MAWTRRLAGSIILVHLFAWTRCQSNSLMQNSAASDQNVLHGAERPREKSRYNGPPINRANNPPYLDHDSQMWPPRQFHQMDRPAKNADRPNFDNNEPQFDGSGKQQASKDWPATPQDWIQSIKDNIVSQSLGNRPGSPRYVPPPSGPPNGFNNWNQFGGNFRQQFPGPRKGGPNDWRPSSNPNWDPENRPLQWRPYDSPFAQNDDFKTINWSNDDFWRPSNNPSRSWRPWNQPWSSRPNYQSSQWGSGVQPPLWNTMDMLPKRGPDGRPINWVLDHERSWHSDNRQPNPKTYSGSPEHSQRQPKPNGQPPTNNKDNNDQRQGNGVAYSNESVYYYSF